MNYVCDHCGAKFIAEIIERGDERSGSADIVSFCPACGDDDITEAEDA